MLSELRRGRITASAVHRCMADGKAELDFGVTGERGGYMVADAGPFKTKAEAQDHLSKLRKACDRTTLSQGAITYALEIVSKMATIEDPRVSSLFDTPAMKWGREKELEGIAASGLDVSHIGEDQKFLLSEDGTWGGTPDGIGKDFILEVKCPTSFIHLQRLGFSDLKQLGAEYYWQMTANAVLAGKEKMIFIDYDPRFIKNALRLKRIEGALNNDDVDAMITKIGMVSDLIKSTTAWIESYE